VRYALLFALEELGRHREVGPGAHDLGGCFRELVASDLLLANGLVSVEVTVATAASSRSDGVCRNRRLRKL
jgi:hypothetical protein